MKIVKIMSALVAVVLAVAVSLPVEAGNANITAQLARIFSNNSIASNATTTATTIFNYFPGAAGASMDWKLSGTSPNVLFTFRYANDSATTPAVWADQSGITYQVTVTSTTGGVHLTLPYARRASLTAKNLNGSNAVFLERVHLATY